MTADIREHIAPQGTQEWREARVGILTASVIPAVLGHSPWTSRRQALERMLAEAMGTFDSRSNPAMRWGNEHEDEARSQYSIMFADGPVQQVGFFTRGKLGASPDGLVGADGVVEIKCPYKLRDDPQPVFDEVSLDQRADYWHQAQCQMWVLDRDYCDFVQWAPMGIRHDRIEREPDWYDVYWPQLQEFLQEFEERLADLRDGGPEAMLSVSSGWREAAEAFGIAMAEKQLADQRAQEARERLIAMVEAEGVDQCAGGGVKLHKITRKGSVDYKALAKHVASAAVVAEQEENFRKADSSSWRVDFQKGDDNA